MTPISEHVFTLKELVHLVLTRASAVYVVDQSEPQNHKSGVWVTEHLEGLVAASGSRMGLRTGARCYQWPYPKRGQGKRTPARRKPLQDMVAHGMNFEQAFMVQVFTDDESGAQQAVVSKLGMFGTTAASILKYNLKEE